MVDATRLRATATGRTGVDQSVNSHVRFLQLSWINEYRSPALDLRGGLCTFEKIMSRQHISELRKFRKLSQSALAKAAGLTVSEISRIECGYRDMTEAEAVLIAKALDVLPAKIDPRLLKVTPPSGMAASGVLAPEPVAPPPSASLESDPANFREVPDDALLTRGTLSEPDYRSRLAAALKRATQILHTPKVPAATWRAWREFERKIQEQLRPQAS
ncbi:MAG: helix-turn-helix transcriptional regulator [Rariglobus sp.]